MRILVTGGLGFIGKHVVGELHRAGHEVVVLTRRLASNDSNVRCISKDSLTEFSEKKCDAIIHLATDYARTGNLEGAWEANYLLPLWLLEQAKIFNVRLFINTDSFSAEHPQVFKHLEGYIRTKNAFKHRFLGLSDGSPKRVNIILSHVIGTGDSNTKFIPWVLDQLIENQQIEVTHCEQKLDFIDAGDVAKAFLCVVNNEPLLPDTIEFEAGSGRATRLRDFLELMRAAVAHKCNTDNGAFLFGKRTTGNVIGSFPANNSSLSQLGWRCNITLDESIEKMIQERIK